ncbi:HesA/MoeB/ThiF family protein [Carnimonas nigrificans]|uniref:HesA/MoeB/ThiF family protein n=1 Tax=Carnimonas nigrificans TaxID=64323 RepID=UPI00046FBD69|nr:molybdopterin-synthase adenylyltransferase MoeB [Carnimonas nigrificans]
MNDHQLLRYSRHVLLPQIDVEGQQRLLNARVVIIGLGGLGSAAALYLAASGIGTLVLADFDRVELSNLQRQIIHNEARLGQTKAASAAQAIAALNPDCQVEIIEQRLDDDALTQQVGQADVVLDCTDRFSSRYAINRACVAHSTPLVSGAAIAFSGQLAVFDLRRADAPCYACLYGEDGDDEATSCAESGVAAPLVGVIGSWQALEALKLISGAGSAVEGLSLFDGVSGQWRQMAASRDAQCPVCSQR